MDVKSLKAELSAIQLKAVTLGDKAQAGTLTDAEAEQLKGLADQAVQVKAQLIAAERGEKNAELMQQVAALGAGYDEPSPSGGSFTTPPTVKSGYLDLSPAGIKSVARNMATQAQGQKALLTGGTVATQVTLAPNVVRMGGGGLALLSSVPVIRHDTPTWKYLRQVTRTNNAGVVAEGDTKPTSIVTATEVDGSLSVFATLSEPVGKYVLRDNAALERFIAQELVYMVNSKVQDAAVSAFVGTSGVQTVSAASEPIVSVRKGVQAVEDLGFEANLLVLNSADYFDIVTTRNAGGTFDVSGGVGAAEEAPRLWGRQVVSVTSGVAPGQALVLDRNAVAIDTDTVGLEVEWNPYAGFDQNTVKARVEGRFGFSVFQPSALALVTLSGA